MSGTRALPYDLLEERYRLESLLGRGGMAAVYRAVDTRLDRPVAVKILGDAPAADDRRFRAEVRTLARFSHPNLVRILDAGEIDDRLYLVMDLIDGPTLSERLRDGALPRHEVARIGSGIASALAYVHEEGIVHRDVKPGNILLDRPGVAYLADFGISRLLDTTGMTTTGQLVGTPAYLAPEQLHGTDVGPPADVYALGLVLLECLRGERTFTGTLSEIAASRMLQGPKIPATLEPRWGALISSMTETDAQRRVPVSEVAGTLGRWSHEPEHPLPVQARLPRHPDPDDGSTAATRVETPGDARTRRQTVSGPAVAARRAPDGRRGVGGTAPSGRGESSRRQLASVLIAGAIALLVGLALGAALLGPGSTRGSALSSKRGLSSAHTGTTPPPRTSTVRMTVTKRTTPPVSTLPAAAGEFVSRLAAREASGDVSPQAGQQLLAQLQPLAFTQQAGAAQQVQQFDQLAQVFDLEVASGQITGTTTVTSLKDAIGTLASVLGTSVPAPTNASQAVPGNDFKPGHGHGNGHGDGFGGG